MLLLSLFFTILSLNFSDFIFYFLFLQTFKEWGFRYEWKRKDSWKSGSSCCWSCCQVTSPGQKESKIGWWGCLCRTENEMESSAISTWSAIHFGSLWNWYCAHSSNGGAGCCHCLTVGHRTMVGRNSFEQIVLRSVWVLGCTGRLRKRSTGWGGWRAILGAAATKGQRVYGK